MNARPRSLGAALLALVVGVFGVVGISPAGATSTTLCTGYSACGQQGMTASGYAANNGTMWWQMYAGHNCTNYAAYRMVKSGLPNTRPWSGEGNATNWGTAMADITDGTPRVGAIAWWKAGVYPAGSSGHVAYVERVISADEIIVSQDSWGGDFSWARITRETRGWPSGFIHFNDVPMLNLAKPAITGMAKVGDTLTASSGTWNPSDATIKYQWRANAVKIEGATAPTYALTPANLNQVMSVRVTASKTGYPTSSIITTPTAAVLPGVLSNPTPPTIVGEPRVDETLTAQAGQWTPKPDGYTYQWSADGVPIAGATAPTLTIDQAEVDKKLTVAVTAARSGYTNVSVDSTPTAPVLAGVLTVTRQPSLVGEARLGETLSLRVPQVSPAADRQVTWLRSGTPIPGADGTSYVVTAADLGERIAARVVLSRPGYTTEVTRTASTPQVRSEPRIALLVSDNRGHLAIDAKVTARGVATVSGVLQVKLGARVLKQVRVRDGLASFTIRGLAPGTRTYSVVFLRTAELERRVVERRLTVR
ncbi:MAG TPA: CHAP domain-containing protein [Nocardioidaceae bacterium]|nr:CHAP domain-containing protein [Nocardioidaceae bacterium]